MSDAPTTDPTFLGTLESWFRSQTEILVLIRYSHAAGSKDFEFFTTFPSLADRIHELPPTTCLTVFKQPQLPFRGVVDDGFIADCLSKIPDGSDYLLLELARRVYGSQSWFHHSDGDTHAELREDLVESRGVAIAIGPYPPWLEDTEEVISAVVPDDWGIVNPGAY